jgi:uncharacterized protein (DUF1330 family)
MIMNVVNALYPEPEQAKAFFMGEEDGPFVMVNLLKFKPKATYEDGSHPDMSGKDAYQIYGDAVSQMVEALGGKIRFSADVTGLMLGEVEDLWDMVALAEYPSLAAFRAMAVSPEMQAISHHRAAGLAGQLNIKTRSVRD